MILAAERITVELGGRIVLEAADCRIEPGRITGIIGPNGAGKSTLLRALAGLIACRVGSITLDGAPIEQRRRPDRAKAIAYLPQDRTVHWPLSTEAVVALGRVPYRLGPTGDSASDRSAIAQAMIDMQVAHLSGRSVATLSGGELARVLFARALAQQSRIILADEPTAGLDPAHALELFSVLQRLAASGRAIAVALHDLSLAARFCHDIVIISDGRVVAAGPRLDVMTQERLGATFGVEMLVRQLEGLPLVLPVAPRKPSQI